jgi:hypothetical protein
MARRIDRRQALGAFGTVSLGALLAACGSDRVETTDGGSRGERDVRNADDGIFDDALLLDLTQEGDGYVGTISFDVAST